MYLIDFIYDDIRLSDLDCMVGYAVTSPSDSVEMGSVINLNTVINHGSYISEIVNADYPEMYTCTFDIFKNPCHGTNDYFTDTEITWFMRWLNRKEYLKFIPIYDDDHSFYKIFLMGTFTTVTAIHIGGEVIGFTLTFTTNSPFSYLDYEPNKFTIDKENDSFIIFDESEELGSIYPKSFTIKVKTSGDLKISNSMDTSDRYTLVKNCVAGEVLTFDCIHKVITSSIGVAHKELYNDFNYVYPRLMNTLKTRENVITVSLPSDIVIEYNPIRKVGVIA